MVALSVIKSCQEHQGYSQHPPEIDDGSRSNSEQRGFVYLLSTFRYVSFSFPLGEISVGFVLRRGWNGSNWG